jgi:hypothetical protein
MEKKLKLNQKNKIVLEWIYKNGAADFDLKKKDIILRDGGIFAIENKPVIKEWTKIVTKPETVILPNCKKGKVSRVDFVSRKYKGKVTDKKIVDFIKKKIKKGECFEEEVLHFFNREKVDHMAVWLWIEELDKTINYLKRMKKMLNKIGYKTR